MKIPSTPFPIPSRFATHFTKTLKTHLATSPSSRLFALIIGINFYDNVRSLRGAVTDALSIQDYLENSLKVPRGQILTLLNKSASRAAIIEAFLSLRDDGRIEQGDPIFIYYAGHGSQISSPEGETGSKLQVLVPQDYCAGREKNVAAIPDRTIGALIAQIAEKKGDNIVRLASLSNSQENAYTFFVDRRIRLLPLCVWYQG